jgi:WXG100 family type VII secretion target
MAHSVEVVVSELHSAAARLADAGQRLQDGLSAVDVEVGQLLGSGWKGGAASAFDKEWDKWHGGAGQVIRGLQTMSQLLTVAGKEYAKTDEQAGAAINSSFQGAGGSAGPATGSNAVGQGTDPSSNAQGASGQGGAGGVEDLAQQMGLGQSMLAPVSQIGQTVTGLAQQAGQAVAGAAQAASGLAQKAAQQQEDQSEDERERDGEPKRPGDAARSGDRAGSPAPVHTAPVDPLRPAPPPSEGRDSSGGSGLSGD